MTPALDVRDLTGEPSRTKSSQATGFTAQPAMYGLQNGSKFFYF